MTVGSMELPPEGMVLGGVALAGDPERGTATTEGLTLLFTVDGITVQGPQPGMERLLAWSGLDAAACRDQTQLEGGRIATILSLTSGQQTVHFLLPAETVSPGQAAYLDQALPSWLARYGRPTGAPERGVVPGAPAPSAPTQPGAADMSATPAATPAATPVGGDRPSPPPVDVGGVPEPTIDPLTGAATWPDPLSGQELTVAAPKKRFWTLRPSGPARPGGVPMANGATPATATPDLAGATPGAAGTTHPGSRRQTLVLLVVLLLV
ncbi:MAG: hypothetical protein ACP5P9_10715, partial [Acidimicrobiales bacterium]